MKNSIQSRTPVVATELRFDGGSRAVGANGELNASNKRDLLRQQARFMEAASTGGIVLEADAISREVQQKQNREFVRAAMADANVHRVLGERMAEAIYMKGNRTGFATRFLNRIELRQGDIPRFPVRKMNVQAFVATSPVKVESNIVLDKWLFPPEFQIIARPFIPQNEINQSVTDVLEEKYMEALQAVMVQQDRLWINMARSAMGASNNLTTIAGTLSPLALMNVRQQVVRWGMKSAYLLMASDLYVDVVGDASFTQFLDPVARHELLLTGELGTIFGMTVISEAYRHAEHKVMNAGEFVVVSDPLYHGAYSDRGGIDSQPTDITVEGKAGRGWVLVLSMSMALANDRSVAVGIRL